MTCCSIFSCKTVSFPLCSCPDLRFLAPPPFCFHDGLRQFKNLSIATGNNPVRHVAHDMTLGGALPSTRQRLRLWTSRGFTLGPTKGSASRHRGVSPSTRRKAPPLDTAGFHPRPDERLCLSTSLVRSAPILFLQVCLRQLSAADTRPAYRTFGPKLQCSV